MRTVRMMVAVTLLGVVTAPAQTKPSLQSLLETEVAKMPARVGVYVKHLGTGEEAAIRGDEAFNSASTRKVPIMVLAFQLADRGQLDLTERVEIRRSDFRDGTGVLQYHDPGFSPTLRDLITEMIITSDNTATELVIRKLGGPERINGWLRESGYVRTKTSWGGIEASRMAFAELGADYANLTNEEVTALLYLRGNNPLFERYRDLFSGARQRLADRVIADRVKLNAAFQKRRSEDEASWSGATSPREMGRWLEAIERKTAASERSSVEMKNILRRQQLGVRRIPHFLTLPVAHKTGDVPPAVANDVGIVDARSGPIVISFFASSIKGSYAEAEDQIGRMAKAIVDYFDGLK